MIRAAIFDADGTLLDSMGIWQQLGDRYLRSRGISPEPGLGDRLYPMSLEEGCAYLKTNYSLPEEVSQISAAVVRILRTFYEREAALKPGAEAFLRALSRKNIPMIVATSGDRENLLLAFRRLKIEGCFQEILTCADLGVSKREPTVYLEAAARLGAAPGETMVFEDVLYGIRGAKSVGFQTAALEDPTNRSEEEALRETADLYIRDFRDAALYRKIF